MIVDKKTKGHIFLGIYLAVSSIVSFFILYPWRYMFTSKDKFVEDANIPLTYNVFNAAEVESNPALNVMYIIFYSLLCLCLILGVAITLLALKKKTSFTLSILAFFGSLFTAWLALVYFLNTKGENFAVLIIFMLGMIFSGFYLATSASNFILKIMDKKAKKKLKEIKNGKN